MYVYIHLFHIELANLKNEPTTKEAINLFEKYKEDVRLYALKLYIKIYISIIERKVKRKT